MKMRTGWYKAKAKSTGAARLVWVELEDKEAQLAYAEGMPLGRGGEVLPLDEVLAAYELLEEADGRPPGALFF